MSQPNPIPATTQLAAILRRARERQAAVFKINQQLWATCQELQLLLETRAQMSEVLKVPAVLRRALGLLEDLAPGWDLGRPLASEFYRLVDPACKLENFEAKLERSYRTVLHSLLLACMVLHAHCGLVCLAIRNGLADLQSDYARSFRATFQIPAEVED